MPINVLVYNGRGVSAEALHQTLHSLRSAVGRCHTISTIDACTLARDPWEQECALLVIPGGRDIPYTEDISHEALHRIKRWIYEDKGRLLGICAGAYFCCEQVIFEPRNPLVSVVGSRELSLCPAIARGTLYGNFNYDTEEGAHAAPIKTTTGDEMKVYYNGGCWFDFGVATSPTLRYTNLAMYSEMEKPAVVAGFLPDAIKPSIVLAGVHLEYDMSEFTKRHPNHHLNQQLLPFTCTIIAFWKSILQLLGLAMDCPTPQDAQEGTFPVHVYMKSKKELNSCSKLLSFKGKILQCEEDSFLVHDKVASATDETNQTNSYQVVLMDEVSEGETFNSRQFFSHLQEPTAFGRLLMHTKSIGSTQSLLQNNPSFTALLPSGTVLLADEQTKGRGRGCNTWLSSTGCLQFTMILRHNSATNVVLIQYLAALSMIEAILSIPEYSGLPLRLKWPNDLYSEWEGELKKLGGVLVTSQVTGSNFCLLVGLGINIHDTPWTRSLNDLIAEYNSKHGTSMPPLNRERVLGAFCSKFSLLYAEMEERGCFPFDLYYSRWMHDGQVVTLAETGEKVRIVGIDCNGYLKVKPHEEGLLGLLYPRTSTKSPRLPKTILLQPDGNSFDMMANLIKRKA